MDVDTGRGKRQRSVSSSSSSSASSSRSSGSSLTPPPKYHRHDLHATSEKKDFKCDLPPTCSLPDSFTSYSTLAELERHQEQFHKWICHTPIRDRDRENGLSSPQGEGKGKASEQEVPETFVHQRGMKRWKECNKVFPEQRLLDLHHLETHDPIVRERKEKGEKVFECFLPLDQCRRKFIDPRQRRKHLIDKHRYPQQYFFSITNHGLNDLVRQDGLAISLIRPRRDYPPASSPQRTPGADGKPDDSQGVTQSTKATDMKGVMDLSKTDVAADVDMDGLTKAMGGLESSLSFVPRGVRKKAPAK